MSVNVSGRQLARPAIVDEIRNAIEMARIAPEHLAIEITETTIIENAEAANTILKEIRDIGVRIHIDDFGTGYSSLSYLKKFPVETLKIDRSFIGKLGLDGEISDLVQTIITLAHVMGLDVIAEGIENQSQGALLEEIECEYGQGYFYSKPFPAADAGQLLEPPGLRFQ